MAPCASSPWGTGRGAPRKRKPYLATGRRVSFSLTYGDSTRAHPRSSFLYRDRRFTPQQQAAQQAARLDRVRSVQPLRATVVQQRPESAARLARRGTPSAPLRPTPALGVSHRSYPISGRGWPGRPAAAPCAAISGRAKFMDYFFMRRARRAAARCVSDDVVPRPAAPCRTPATPTREPPLSCSTRATTADLRFPRRPPTGTYLPACNQGRCVFLLAAGTEIRPSCTRTRRSGRDSKGAPGTRIM